MMFKDAIWNGVVTIGLDCWAATDLSGGGIHRYAHISISRRPAGIVPSPQEQGSRTKSEDGGE